MKSKCFLGGGLPTSSIGRASNSGLSKVGREVCSLFLPVCSLDPADEQGWRESKIQQGQEILSPCIHLANRQRAPTMCQMLSPADSAMDKAKMPSQQSLDSSRKRF